MTQAGRDVFIERRCLRASTGRWRNRWLLGLSCLWLAGCSTTEVFQANALPGHLQAVPIESAKTLDLSRLGSGSTNYDLIDRGDLLEVTIVASLRPGDTHTIPVRVNENGTVTVSDIGDVPVAGLEPESAEAEITAAAVQRGIYRAPRITVAMKKQRTNRIMVVGAVKEPRTYNLPCGSCDLLSAIVAAGGLADDAGTNVEVRNPPAAGSVQPDRIAQGYGASGVLPVGHSQTVSATTASRAGQSFRIDLVSATKDGTASYPLPDGAVVMIERRDPQPVYVGGLVHKPGEIPYPNTKPLSVLAAIAEAGGASNQLANKVFVIRQMPGQPEPSLIEVSIRAAKRNGAENIRLSPGDIVNVEQTPGTVVLETMKLIRFGVGTSLGTIF